MRLDPGSRLGPYEIVAAIGAGGMGEVYRARDSRLGREVAVKVLPKEVATDASRLARFEREARSASALNHPNIITIHDFTSSNGEAWLVMELIRGESLRSLLLKGPLPLKRVISLGSAIANGLAAAHNAGIVHRDLKPENIMIAADGTPKILDFGLVKKEAKTSPDSPTELRVSHTGAILGTANYMSPEQARGDDVDFRTDQFSFGMILHEMATGRHPFARRTPVDTLAAILNDDPEPVPDTLPLQLRWIIERCLQRDPAGRYGSTSDLAHDLAHSDESPVVPRVSRRRSSRLLLIVPAMLIAVAAVAFWLRPAVTPVADPIRVDIAVPELARVVINETTIPASIAPDGRSLLISGIAPDGVDGIWIRDLRTGTTRLLVENGKMPAWSEDGKLIAFFAEGKLKTIGPDGGPARAICDARPESTPAWIGRSILFGQYSVQDRGLYRVSADGGAPVLFLAATIPDRDIPFSPPWWPQALPDGRLLFVRFGLSKAQRIDHELRVASADGKQEKVIAAFNSRALYAGGHLLFIRDGTLMAQPFDLKKTELTGEARPVLTGVHYFRSTGLGAFTVSNNGIIAWRSAMAPSRIVWLDRTGSEGASLGTVLAGTQGRISPDGQRYAVGVLDPQQGVSDIWTFELARDNRQRLTTAELDEKAPVWYPDSRVLLYRSDGAGGPPDIFRLQPGDQFGQVLHSGRGVEEPHDISSDGKWLLYVDHFATGTDISLLPLDPKGAARPLIATRFYETSPRFSPDVRWIAYESNVSGTNEVYLRSFADPPVSTRVSNKGGSHPRWRADGRELYYLDPEGRLMATPVENGVAGVPRTLFQNVEINDFEPAADGSRFLTQLQQGSRDTPVHLLINWK